MRSAAVWIPMLGICCAVMLAVRFAYRRDRDAAEARITGTSEILQTALGPVEYAATGRPGANAVLLIHGAGGGFDQLLDLDAGGRLSRQGFRLIFVSRFGYLRTPLPANGGDAGAEAQADAHAALLDALGIHEAAVVGVSAGGSSALQFAARYPDRCKALILLVPAVPAGEQPLPRPSPLVESVRDTILGSDFLFWTLMRLFPGMLTETVLATPRAVAEQASPADRARMRTVMANILPVSRRRDGLANDSKVIPRLRPLDWEKIRSRTLAISVEDDLFGTATGARYAAGRIAGARCVIYPSGGHLWLGHDQEVYAEVERFLHLGVGRGN